MIVTVCRDLSCSAEYNGKHQRSKKRLYQKPEQAKYHLLEYGDKVAPYKKHNEITVSPYFRKAVSSNLFSERGHMCITLCTINFVSFIQREPRKMRSVLDGYTAGKCFPCHFLRHDALEILYRLLQSFIQRDIRIPTQFLFCQGYIRLSLSWVI